MWWTVLATGDAAAGLGSLCAGTSSVELGVPVCVVKDHYYYRFVLGWSVLWEGEDVHVAVPLIEAVRATYPELRACSFDKGFHSPASRARLDALLPDGNVLPQKGKLGKAAEVRELDPAFVAVRRRHPSVESDAPCPPVCPRARPTPGPRGRFGARPPPG